jgi:aspartyl-tRNA(Asn)/glutamyl-tRNA(Gln) amidotransferase subunit B
MSATSDKYEVVIGIETHVQLKTKTKLFCACDNDARDSEPNTKVCPVCMGFPGSLPVLNEQAVKLALKAGLALNAELPVHTKFDRKNYFYPDLPSGYQITQFDKPIIGQGYVEFPSPSKKPGFKARDEEHYSSRPGFETEETFRVGITRAHMEADAGKLTHPEGADYSLVDYNRSGTPLIEIVSEPDMRSAAQAKVYAQEVYNLMRYADVSEANLYYGNMRFDINVSVRLIGTKEFGTRTETKNLNSFRSIERAAEYEINRQIEVLERGDKVVQETRGWSEAKQQTFSQRSKEEAHDYRYFPEPDLPPLVITDEMRREAEASMPAMPNEIRKEMQLHGLDGRIRETIIGNISLVSRYRSVVEQGVDPKKAANLLVEVNKLESDNSNLQVSVSDIVEVTKMINNGQLSSTAAKEVLRNALPGKTPADVAGELNLLQNSDSSAIESLVDEAIAANPQSVQDYKSGKPQALGFLVGQVMKASRGQANPPMVNELLKSKLG